MLTRHAEKAVTSGADPLAILGLEARDIMGYTFTMFLACFPAALIAVTLLAPHVTG